MRITLLIIVSFFLLTFRLLDTPPGLTIDEAAFGYNATLLARTLHDQNSRFLPVFVLSIDGKDWRQPVTQYYQAAFFRLFGASVYNLRFSSVVITIASLLLLYYLTAKLLSKTSALLAAIVFITSPIVFFQSHLGLDNNVPVLFTLLWLISLYHYSHRPRLRYLFLAGVSLGLSFYSYKAMRAILPVWAGLTIVYLFLDYIQHPTRKNLKHCLISFSAFILGLLPFLAVIPWLNTHYAGAVFDKHQASWGDLYSFLYPYLSSFDLSFLYLQGDATLYHSTQKHGMFLLASLPLFLIGLYRGVKKDRFWLLIITSLFAAPLLFGMVNSVHRASRLMALIPQYCLIASLSIGWIKQQRLFLPAFSLFFLLYLANFYDFVTYFWYRYPTVAQTEHAYSQLYQFRSFKSLADNSRQLGLVPYISRDVYQSEGENAHFFESLYFTTPLYQWENKDQPPPSGSILLSNRDSIPGMQPLPVPMPLYHLHVTPQDR